MADFFDIFWHDHILGWFWPLVQFLIGLNVVVFIHELGHFMAARWAGVKVERFALGMGPRLFGFVKGETDYCICALPLGGYVKMLGQDDFAPRDEKNEMVADDNQPEQQKLDPRSYNAATPSKRLVIISAGVVMNVILAAFMFILVALIGHKFPAPTIGGTAEGMPASQAKIVWNDATAKLSPELKPGDTVLAINDEPIKRFSDIRKAGAYSESDTQEFAFKIQRTVNGKTYTGTATVKPKRIKEGFSVFGLMPSYSNKVLANSRNLQNNIFKTGDTITKVNDKPITAKYQIDRIQKSLSSNTAKITVIRDGKTLDLTVHPALVSNCIITKSGDKYPTKDVTVELKKDAEGKPLEGKVVYKFTPRDSKKAIEIEPADIVGGFSKNRLVLLGMTPVSKISQVIKHTPAFKAGLKPGDIIVNYGDHETPTIAQFIDITKKAKGKTLKLTYLREGKPTTIELAAKSVGNSYQIGIMLGIDERDMTIGNVLENSTAAKVGISKDSIIKSVNGVKVKNWVELYDLIKADTENKKPIEISIEQAGKIKSYQLGNLSKKQFNPKLFSFALFGNNPIEFEPLKIKIQFSNPIAALKWGIGETTGMITQSWTSVKRMVTGRVSPKAMSGPLGIGKIAVDQAKSNFMDLFYLIAIISASLAFFNFLPIPVLDGGHAVLIIIEMIRRKPLPVKLVNTIQIVGLFLILGLFLTVTFFDITKFM